MTRVFVDADSCARLARDWLLSRAKKGALALYFAANKSVAKSEGVPNFTMVVVPQESQAADKWILENALPGDIAVTRDIPLASSLLQKGVFVINDFGKVFDKTNIERALKERALSLQMKALGLGTKGRDSYGQKEFEAFAKGFETLLARRNAR